MRSYYTLLTRDGDYHPWSPQFGDYRRKTVEYERLAGVRPIDLRMKDTRILKTGDTQGEIDEGIRHLNKDRLSDLRAEVNAHRRVRGEKMLLSLTWEEVRDYWAQSREVSA